MYATLAVIGKFEGLLKSQPVVELTRFLQVVYAKSYVGDACQIRGLSVHIPRR